MLGCKHKKYTIIQCSKGKKVYICRCLKCGKQFELPKALDEMYAVGSIIKH